MESSLIGTRLFVSLRLSDNRMAPTLLAPLPPSFSNESERAVKELIDPRCRGCQTFGQRLSTGGMHSGPKGPDPSRSSRTVSCSLAALPALGGGPTCYVSINNTHPIVPRSILD
ncbi:hypothetical protein EYF80_003760 [Liparis tanakae]|uniref:Uncharacterized protein n=1 Tax=Liparis tanakae TaxID=230148 RepID=A0A4Z2J6V0_9TELE|nr:hypothetical protein EYF80_003760 [Liparis tanakae]